MWSITRLLWKILDELKKQTQAQQQIAANVQSIVDELDTTPVGFKIRQIKL
jgi:hypothetical protein